MVIMNLNKYLALNAIKQNDFAEKIGDKPQNINKYCFGARIPRPKTMKKIFDATQGQVTPNDFYDLPAEPAEDTTPAAGPACPDPTGGADA